MQLYERCSLHMHLCCQIFDLKEDALCNTPLVVCHQIFDLKIDVYGVKKNLCWWPCQVGPMSIHPELVHETAWERQYLYRRVLER